MPKGRPALPDELKKAKGTLRPGRVNSEAPKVLPGMPEIPLGLTGIAKKKFVELSQELVQMRVITPHDRLILEQISKEWELFKELEKTIKKDGLFYHSRITEIVTETTPEGEKVATVKEKVTSTAVKLHPAVKARNQCWANIMKGLQECGLTPSTRNKLKIVQKEEVNPFVKIMGMNIP